MEELCVVTELLDMGKGREDHGAHGGSERRRRTRSGVLQRESRGRESELRERGRTRGARASPSARSRTGKEAGGGGEMWPRSAVRRARSSSYWQELEEAPGGWAGGLGREKLGQATGRPGKCFPLSFSSVLHFL